MQSALLAAPLAALFSSTTQASVLSALTATTLETEVGYTDSEWQQCCNVTCSTYPDWETTLAKDGSIYLQWRPACWSKNEYCWKAGWCFKGYYAPYGMPREQFVRKQDWRTGVTPSAEYR